jgi:hypothetical protein
MLKAINLNGTVTVQTVNGFFNVVMITYVSAQLWLGATWRGKVPQLGFAEKKAEGKKYKNTTLFRISSSECWNAMHSLL